MIIIMIENVIYILSNIYNEIYDLEMMMMYLHSKYDEMANNNANENNDNRNDKKRKWWNDDDDDDEEVIYEMIWNTIMKCAANNDNDISW